MKIRVFIFLLSFLGLLESSSAQVSLKQAGNISDQYLVYFNISFDITKRIKQQKSKAFNFLRENQRKNIDQLKEKLADTDLQIKRSLWIKQSVAVTISSQYLEELKALPIVSAVKSDTQYEIEALGVTDLEPSGESVQDNLFSIGVESLWNAGYRGQGVVVAIIDSGVDIKHEALKSRWRGGSNSWYDPLNSSVEPVDFSGHGTAVASIVMGGNENKTNSFLGVAPDAQWIAAKIFANNNATSTSAIQDALQWVMDPDGDAATDDYPDIVQNSWGLASTEESCTNSDFNDSLDAINALGIDIVFSTGNSGPTASSRLAPSFHRDVISVGAIDTSNTSIETILNESSRGPNLCEATLVPALMAPGVLVVSAEPSLGSVSAVRNTGSNTGTSFSSPHVSGALALLHSQFNSSVDHKKIRQALFDSAKDLGTTGDDADFGRGLVKVDAAMGLMLNDTGNEIITPVIGFSNAQYVFFENDLNREISIIRRGDISKASSTNILSEAATAASGADFIPVSIQVDFAAGESLKSISIELVNDTEGENSEFFYLVNADTAEKLKISINDDDDIVEEDVIGGSSSGIFQLFFLLILLIGRRALR